MTQEEKISSLSENKKQEFLKQVNENIEEIKIKFIINEKPVPYARARLGRNKRFYNPKTNVENKYKKICLNQLDENTYKKLQELIKDENKIFFVKANCEFYVPIQKNESIKNIFLKENKIIRPTIRNGDIDNYVKLILDSLHDVIYSDDKVVTSISAEKYFSIKPRSEINITITIIK